MESLFATGRGLCGVVLQGLLFPLSFLFQRMALTSAVSYEINGRQYRMRHLLGEGGFSFVYKVTDASGRGFALKKILAQSEELLEGGLREIEVLRTFGGRPHVLQMVDSCVADVRPGVKEILILLPHYDRGTLQDSLDTKMAANEADNERPFFTEKEALALFDGICAGLLHFHNHSPEPMAHYDLKPGNVLLSESNTPVLMDFGSVRPARQQISSRREALQLQEFASINCTMPYRAPELWEPASQCTIDERVDSWSLGCVLYALCYGRSPFDVSVGEVGASVAVAVASGRVEFPTPESPAKKGRPGARTSDGFQDLIRGMLTLEPDRRLSVVAAQERGQALLSGQAQP